MKKGGIGSSLRWQHRKILNSPSPMETVNSYICKDFLLKKKNLKVGRMMIIYPANNKKITSNQQDRLAQNIIKCGTR